MEEKIILERLQKIEEMMKFINKQLVEIDNKLELTRMDVKFIMESLARLR